MTIDWNKPQPAPKALWNLVKTQFPRARFLGIYNNRPVRGKKKPSTHAEGRALDIGLFVTHKTEKQIGDGLFQLFIRQSSELGLHHVIWNKQIWSSSKGGPRKYTGVNPHTDHVHLAFTRSASQKVLFPKTKLELSVLRTGLEELKIR